MVFPVKRNGGGLDRDASFLFFGIVIGGGCTLIDTSDFVNEVGVKEHPFGNGRFSRIDMGDDADVADVL
jgi:hypothetical protein